MTDYRKLYFMLFNSLTETIENMQKHYASLLTYNANEETVTELELFISEIKQLQVNAEEAYIKQN